MKYAFNKIKLLVLIVLSYLGIVYFLNTVVFQSGFFDEEKLTNSKYPINLQVQSKAIKSISYTYTQEVDNKTYETKYYLHIYKQENKYFFIMSENKNLKNIYFTTSILSIDYVEGIYKELLKSDIKNIDEIMNNFSLISLVERNDIKLTNHYYLPIWQIIKDENINKAQEDLYNKIQTIIKK